ncbi:MAG: gamma-glutamyltransferase [Syntrophales bacterium]|nr:gamma-glutamyltransferase [Syntrophales bacterium]
MLRRGYAYVTGRPVVMGARHMIATSHYLASAAGYSMLDRGGSAADALIAANAVLCVVYNHMAGLGGDMFAQAWSPGSGTVTALNGSGRSGERVDAELYRSRGWDEIHARGPLAANTVPGVVHAWSELHRKFGKLGWEALFGPAVGYARNGFPVSQKFSDYVAQYSGTIRRFESAARIYLPGGNAPPAGSVLKQEDLASSLETIASEGPQSFYTGSLGRKIIEGLRNAGGVLTEDDFGSHASEWVDPLRTTYRGYEVTELPPNTQGIATLMLLNILETCDMEKTGEGTADYYHMMTEAVKLVFADRDEWIGDPGKIAIPYDRLLSKDYARDRADEIDMKQARPPRDIRPGIPRKPQAPSPEDKERRPRPGASGDTCYMCAVDGEGLCVSMIQSVYFEFGSAFMPPGTGILLQNRGSFFKLDPDDVNFLEPRKRPFHTIIPAMALKDGKPALLFGTMGGEGQPQTQAAMLTRLVDFGFNVQEAIEAPRWLYGRTWGEESSSLKVESRVRDGILTDLQRRGHDVQILEHFSQKMGHAQAIRIDRASNTLHGGADPRGEGIALGA